MAVGPKPMPRLAAGDEANAASAHPGGAEAHTKGSGHSGPRHVERHPEGHGG